MVDERRQWIRHSTSATFLVINRNGGELIGRVLDISPYGVLLATEEAVTKDVQLECRMNFPFWHGLHQSVDFTMTSRWCQKNIHLDWFESGWRIDLMSDIDRKVIVEMIDEWDVLNNRGSFRIRVPDKWK